MKKQLLIALLTLGLAAPVFAQQDTTRDAKEMKKDRKAEKKADKGKEEKAMKKERASDKKDDKDK